MPPNSKRRLKNFLVKARDAGLPRDQIQNFIDNGYIPLEQFLAFHAEARRCDYPDGADHLLCAGTRDSGKTMAVFQQVVEDCQRFPGLKWLILRLIKKSARESVDDLVYKCLHSVPHEYTPSEGRILFPNTSRILIGGYKDPADALKYLGIEYDGIATEETTSFDEERYNRMGGSTRSSLPGWRVRRYNTTNADGIGVNWIKKKFVIPWRNGQQTYTRYFESFYYNNPFCKPEYRRYLDGLSGALRKAWRELDWEAFEGMAFNFSYDLHVVEPFAIPNSYYVWRSVDWGEAAPWACLWHAKDPYTGHSYTIREAYKTGLTDRAAALTIIEMTPPEEHIQVTFADPKSFWEKKSIDDRWVTPNDTYRKLGVYLVPADNSRIMGKRRVDEALALGEDGLPKHRIFKNCKNLIEQLMTLPRDPNNPEDVNTKSPDHAYDAFRYGLTNQNTDNSQRKKEEQRQRDATIREALEVLRGAL